ncbi:hypothetical protein KFF47_08975 [Pseudomonas fluorescens]|nr:hypothetical protein [Pseudomonas fluorescens]
MGVLEKKYRRPTEENYITQNMSDRVDFVEGEIQSLSYKIKGLDYSNHDVLISNTVETIKKLAHEEIWHELTDQSLKIAQIKYALAPIEETYNNARARLLSEVAALGRRGTANLVFGVITTTAALVVLSSLALNTIGPEAYRLAVPNGQLDLGVLTLMFVPKLSLAIFVQAFSLFFLRLYKAGFSEIKYFQNELTNLEVKYLGVVSAVLADDEAAVREASKSLLAVERNHVLSKGQTTIDLEKYKIESRSSSELMKLLPKIFEKKIPNDKPSAFTFGPLLIAALYPLPRARIGNLGPIASADVLYPRTNCLHQEAMQGVRNHNRDHAKQSNIVSLGLQPQISLFGQ